MASPTSKVLMAKSKTKSSSCARSRNVKSARSSAGKIAPRSSTSRRDATKQDRVLAMLRSRGCASIAALVRTTGWQPHSVRGFLAGVVKKKLGLNLASEMTNAGRVYRIVAAKASAASPPKTSAEQAHA
jgi:Protein of unknown function (DUF3489)